MEVSQIIKERRKKKLRTSRKSVIPFNKKIFKKSFVISRNKSNVSPQNSNHEFEFYTTISKSFDWETQIQDELETNRKEVQWKTFKRIQNAYTPEKPDLKNLFKKIKKIDQKNFSYDEMWSYNSKNHPVPLNSDDKNCEEIQKKIFWKTSKISLPMLFKEIMDDKTESRNMLWRSLKHIQRFYKENYEDMKQISEIFNTELQKMTENDYLRKSYENFLCETVKSEPIFKKSRLSRWTFLRHDNSCRRVIFGSFKSRQNRYFKQRKNYVEDSNKFSENKCFTESFLCIKNFKSDDKSFESCDSCQCSSCSSCSCDTCCDDSNCKTLQTAFKQLSENEMAPNTEEESRISFENKRTWGIEFPEKEPLRPPVYNPEDYATSLKKWGKKSMAGMQMPLYLSQSTGSIDRISEELRLQHKKQSSSSTKSSSSIKSSDNKLSKKEKELSLKIEKKELKNKENINKEMKYELLKDLRNPILTLSTQEGEMTLRQFSSVTELLKKLKVDLKLSFPSFVQEFVGDPVDGVTLLLELLRAVQLSQASPQQRCPPQVLRRALLDEHSCLVCLKYCLRCSDATRRLASSSAGLFTLAVCIMNNVTQTRIIALELLTKACEHSANGHKAVSEALSTLRLRFGEPVRFRFLIGMLNSAGSVELLAAAMKFINVFMESAPTIQQKIYIQAELEQAGFDSKTLRKTLPCNSESVKVELNKWEKNYFDVESLQSKVVETNSLHEKIQILEKRIQILQEEKGILLSLEQCLKEKCSELEEKVSMRNNTVINSSTAKPFGAYISKQNKKNAERGESTPAEDEGISSSEQELSQDEDYKGVISYENSNDFEQVNNTHDSRGTLKLGDEIQKKLNKIQDKSINNNYNFKNLKNTRCETMKETNVDDGNEIIAVVNDSNNLDLEDETTIDEVIEELENIVNDAETEAYSRKEKEKPSPRYNNLSEVTREEKFRTYSKSAIESFEETEIIPSLLHPQPPRKAKSLVHIYFPGRNLDSQDHVKSEFFDDDTDSETSDSLLTAAREKKSHLKSCHKSLEVSNSFNSHSSVNTRTIFIKEEIDYEDSELNVKMGYEERNIDEEENKRKHFKNPSWYKLEKWSEEFFLNHTNSPQAYAKKVNQNEKMIVGSSEKLNEISLGKLYEKIKSVQGIRNSPMGADFNDTSVVETKKFIPTPVKRSQTFHMSTSIGDKLLKKNEIKPKPKMGVSGLDFQRCSDQKLKNDSGKQQSVEYKKNADKRSDANERYSKKFFKEQKNQEKCISDDTGLLVQKNFEGLFLEAKPNQESETNKTTETVPRFGNASLEMHKPCSKRSKSLEKMDEGLDSMVDIVIASEEIKKPKTKNEWNVEVTKNIGPRTRRSLAESSLFTSQFSKSISRSESPKPPKPAQRTSLTRNNSSSAPFHLPIEIKLAPVQPNKPQQYIYNFGLKPGEPKENLEIAAKRYSPDGACSPLGSKKSSHECQKNFEKKLPIYSTPNKQSKLQKFFGNPKFDNNTGTDASFNSKYFENNYACASSQNEKLPNPLTRNIQNMTSSTTQKVKNFISSSNQQNKFGGKNNQQQSKPNFLLGTYQSQPLTNGPLKPISNSTVLNSISNINNNFMNKKGIANNKIESEIKKNSQEHLPISEKNDVITGRQFNPGSTEKVTDSVSGLY